MEQVLKHDMFLQIKAQQLKYRIVGISSRLGSAELTISPVPIQRASAAGRRDERWEKDVLVEFWSLVQCLRTPLYRTCRRTEASHRSTPHETYLRA